MPNYEKFPSICTKCAKLHDCQFVIFFCMTYCSGFELDLALVPDFEDDSLPE